MTEVQHRSLVSRLYRGETRIDFIGSRKRWYLASAILILICISASWSAASTTAWSSRAARPFQFPVSGTSLTTLEARTPRSPTPA